MTTLRLKRTCDLLAEIRAKGPKRSRDACWILWYSGLVTRNEYAWLVKQDELPTRINTIIEDRAFQIDDRLDSDRKPAPMAENVKWLERRTAALHR